MQKKLIALALASLAGSAFAQSNVTIYGVADVAEVFVKSSGADNGGPGVANTATNQKSVARLDSNSSYIGFKGVEDLGNGLKAVWLYETGFAADTNGGLTGGRDSYLGLTGAFGTAIAGNLTHPLRAMNSRVELLPGAAGVGTINSLTGTIAGIATGADDRAANAIAYVTPTFSGFSGTVAWVNGERKTNAQGAAAQPGTLAYDKSENSRQYQIYGQYENGPLWVGAGYHEARDSRTVLDRAGDNATAKIWRLGATYMFPTNTKVTALWDNTKQDVKFRGLNPVPSSNEASRNAWMVGVAQTFAAKHTVGLEYAKSQKISGSACDANTGVIGDCSDTAKSMYTLLYTYDFSKRTQLHARYSHISNKYSATGTNADANFYNNPVLNNGNVVTGAGADFTAFGIGLRHNF